MPLPAIKLFSLAVKELIGKRIAKQVKETAKSSPWIRHNVVVPLAQFYTRSTVKIRSRLLGIGEVKSVQPVSEDRAVELAGDFAGEITIILIAAGLIFFEINRQNKKVETANDATREIIESLKDKVEELELCVKKLDLKTEKMEAEMKNLNTTLFYSKHGITSKVLSVKKEQNTEENVKSKS
ncbi:putative OPA3-like protein CG13603 [Ylistrum balloti]|uniref:putative OPA3-like protein CG13603 n=1 Tax=Ylistrum balloti TaxID=509963 RepID=UPI002905D3EE|nr:putative OPA3-like protein CG13603 [Ylistrum balloti]